MIKSLLGEDENIQKKAEESPEVKGEKEDSTQNSLSLNKEIKTQENVKTENIVDPPNDEIESFEEIKSAIVTGRIPQKEIETTQTNNSQNVQPFEVDKPIGQPIGERKPIENIISNEQKQEVIKQENENSTRALELEKKLREIEQELKVEKDLELQRLKKENAENVKTEQQKTQKTESIENVETATVVSSKEVQSQLFEDNWDKEDAKIKAENENAVQITQKDFVPETKAEGFRKMGMAWSAAIAFFGSVVFMLILGWGADLLLGSEPWGIVVGIIFGGVIGFIQLIRTTSQIFKPKPNDFDKVSLKSNIENVVDKKVEETKEEKYDIKIEEDQSEVTAQEVVGGNEPIADGAETIAKTDS